MISPTNIRPQFIKTQAKRQQRTKTLLSLNPYDCRSSNVLTRLQKDQDTCQLEQRLSVLDRKASIEDQAFFQMTGVKE